MSWHFAQHSSNNQGSDASIRDGFHATVQLGAQVIAWTEMIQDNRAATLKDVTDAADWGFWARNEKPYDNCAITWQRKNWSFEDAGYRILSDITWKDQQGHTKAKFAAIAVLLRHHTDDKAWTFVALHGPPASTDDQGSQHNQRSAAMTDGMVGLEEWMAELDAQWPQTGTVITGDWNLDFGESWVRDWLEDQLGPTYRVMGGNQEPPAYPDTHGHKTLDWLMMGGAVGKVSPATAHPMPDSDHKTLLVELTLTD